MTLHRDEYDGYKRRTLMPCGVVVKPSGVQ
jgi:hypothetical protein